MDGGHGSQAVGPSPLAEEVLEKTEKQVEIQEMLEKLVDVETEEVLNLGGSAIFKKIEVMSRE